MSPNERSVEAIPQPDKPSAASAETSTTDGVGAKKPRRSTIARNALRVALGLGVGLVVAEGAFYVRDGGSFPHLNVYIEDADRGVRLRPNATEKIRFSKNPITSIRINSEGYRGAEWPAPAPTTEEVIVVGDSQVLGLGVEENETFSAVLQSSLGGGHLVRNLGVPTYGPPEYNGVIEEALAKRPAKTVVYVVNLANDLFEAKRRNKERHVVWDGWAVRKETAPTSVTKFPGRSFLYTDSHAVFALRGWLYGRGEKSSEQGFASEGTWRDIGDAAGAAQAEHSQAEVESARLAKLREAQIKYADDRANIVAKQLDSKVISDIPYEDVRDDRYDWDNPNFVPKEALFEAGRLNPGDIVNARNGEEGRDVKINAEHIRRGAALRVAFEKKVREQAEKKKDKETIDLFAQRDEMAKKAAELKAAPPAKVVPMSPLAPALRDAKATCDRHGARLVVVALPIDVQVSKAEWAKYGVSEPIDMEATKVLNEDVVIAAKAIGADGFDAFQALSDAEPGAFLDGDLHMTPKGHRAVGEALAKVLRAPKVAIPGEGLPPFRSYPPKPKEWTPITEIAVRESDPAGCETKKVREWLGIFCRHKPAALGVVVTSGTEVMAGSVPGHTMLIAPILPGQDVKATFAYEGASRDFVVKATDAATGTLTVTADIGFTKPQGARADIKGASTEVDAFCKCFVAQNPGKTCADATVVPDGDCARTYASDCPKLLACDAGDPAHPATCPTGFARAGAAGRCHELCTTDPKAGVGGVAGAVGAVTSTCKNGQRCTRWQGGDVCM